MAKQTKTAASSQGQASNDQVADLINSMLQVTDLAAGWHEQAALFRVKGGKRERDLAASFGPEAKNVAVMLAAVYEDVATKLAGAIGLDLSAEGGDEEGERLRAEWDAATEEPKKDLALTA